MKLSDISAPKNLRLAWHRLLTSRNLQYKRFYRPLLSAYNIAADQNLKLLSDRLRSGWAPGKPERLFIPKPSGLQRPLGLLALDDLIVLQAVANVAGEKVRKRRNKVVGRTCFSNWPGTKGSVFFVTNWQTSYFAFKQALEKHFKRGYRWVVHFDLTAFYDTISHASLLHTVAPRMSEADREKLSKWFQTWASPLAVCPLGHGLPQGPAPSDFLADIFMLPVDEQMQREKVAYLRYVDDIRIFGRTEQEVQRGSMILEELCRNRGLLPHGEKFGIRKCATVQEALGSLPSIPPSDPSRRTPDLKPPEALRLIKQAVSGRPLKVTDKARFRYVLYRAEPSAKLLDLCLRLLPRHLEHIDAFEVYFSNYTKSKKLENAVAALLLKVPYLYVRGELWHVLARIASPSTRTSLLRRANNELPRCKNSISLEWGVLHFLLSSEKQRKARTRKALNAARGHTIALLAPALTDEEFRAGAVVCRALADRRLAIAHPPLGVHLVSRCITAKAYGLKASDFTEEVRNVFRNLGLVRAQGVRRLDKVDELIRSCYAIAPWSKWKKLLGSDYPHAVQILTISSHAFSNNPSEWLSYQNSFNDLLVRKVIGVLAASGSPHVVKIVDGKGHLVKFGSLVQSGGAFDAGFPTITLGMREANQRRNKIPGSHPYDEKGGAQNRFLKKPEQRVLVGRLKNAYGEIVRVLDPLL